MNRVIWKFDVHPAGFVVEMPRGARLLTVALQSGPHEAQRHYPHSGALEWAAAGPRVWALVDTDAPRVKRRLATVGTGQPLPDETDGWACVGSFQMHGGALVFHLFDAGEEG